jgi:hypothetical protein
MDPQRWRKLFLSIREPGAPGGRQELLVEALRLGHDAAPGIVGCSVTELDGAHYRTPAASTDVALELDYAQYADSAGPCVNAARDRQPQQIDRLDSEARFRGFVAAALRHGVRSSLSLPVATRYHPTALNLYSSSELAFAVPQARNVAGLLTRMITALLAPPDASAQLVAAEGDARQRGQRVAAAVEQLMREHGLDRPDAFNIMTERSRAHQSKLQTIAEQILDGKG